MSKLHTAAPPTKAEMIANARRSISGAPDVPTLPDLSDQNTFDRALYRALGFAAVLKGLAEAKGADAGDDLGFYSGLAEMATQIERDLLTLEEFQSHEANMLFDLQHAGGVR